MSNPIRIKIPQALMGALECTFPENRPFTIIQSGKRSTEIQVSGDLQDMIEQLTDEICTMGIESDGEMNAHGIQLDRIISVLASARDTTADGHGE